jgi:hypothetical protein
MFLITAIPIGDTLIRNNYRQTMTFSVFSVLKVHLVTKVGTN